ncbi:MAG: ATP-dependent protease ATPase subunit HslU [Myxococcales bacterium]|nr:ATP-dependent protease ATPase subunit HslU [Myxococcales bacterium]
MSAPVGSFTPREIVGELDRYIVGQRKAKRAVAIALRNRWRRQQVPDELRDEIVPKNIIMIGPTGVGKTEIARRLSRLAQAPFVKVEASKFTEVGYVGRDVESIVRDLVEVALSMVRSEQRQQVATRAREQAERRLLSMLERGGAEAPSTPPTIGPFLVSSKGAVTPPSSADRRSERLADLDADELKRRLRAGELDDELVEFEVQDNSNPLVSVFGGQGLEEVESQMRDMLSNLPGFKGKRELRKMRVAEAREVLEEEEAQSLIEPEAVKREALRRAQQHGIVFLDEIDKVAGQRSHSGADVSREGVQRDLLPIVEGSTVSTKHGQVKTDHILFIAAGAFHVAKVSDLIPELQGRFPIRVELESLEKADFERILKEPKNALTRQYAALMQAEGVELQFTDDAIAVLAEYAEQANRRAENIGARRLHTLMEALLDELSFAAPEQSGSKVRIDGAEVRRVLAPIMDDQDLARFIL